MVQESITLHDVTVECESNIIGGAQSVEVTWTQDTAAIHEAGSKNAREIVKKKIDITGSVEHLFLDKSSVTNYVDLEKGDSPYLTLTGTTKNKTPKRKVAVSGVVFDSFTLTLGLDSEVKVPLNFKALDLRIE